MGKEVDLRFLLDVWSEIVGRNAYRETSFAPCELVEVCLKALPVILENLAAKRGVYGLWPPCILRGGWLVEKLDQGDIVRNFERLFGNTGLLSKAGNRQERRDSAPNTEGFRYV